jgi:hypothetical protein
MLQNPVIAGAIIINEKIELEPLTMPTSMIEPNAEFDTAALWGNNLQSARFVAIDSNDLIGSVLRIISKANAIEHKFAFFYYDLRKELIDRISPTDKLNDATKTEDVDMPVLALLPKVIPFEFESDPPNDRSE